MTPARIQSISETDKVKNSSGRLITIIACISVIAILICTIWILTAMTISLSNLQHKEAFFGLFARLMHVTLAMIVGMVVCIFGVVIAWFGVQQEIHAEGETDYAKLKLVAAGPGTLLVLCGTIIILFTLVQSIEYDSSQSKQRNEGSVTGTASFTTDDPNGSQAPP